MAMVDVYSSIHLLADSQPKSVALVWGLAATQHSVCIHQMNQVNSSSDYSHDNSTTNVIVVVVVVVAVIIITIITIRQ